MKPASKGFVPAMAAVAIWGVMNVHVVETSLGYFIGPLVNVLLGVVSFREAHRRAMDRRRAGCRWYRISHAYGPRSAVDCAPDSRLSRMQQRAFAGGQHGRINPLPGQHAERK